MASVAGEQLQVQAPQYFIKRPRLTRLLDETECRIIMLVAPAGYGKTTLAREWLENRPHVWYSGTSAASDVAALAVAIAQTTHAVLPGAGDNMRDRLRATGTPEQDVAVLAEMLAEDLQDWPDDLWLAFDDYQFAAESDYSERFIDLLCSRTPIRLLLTSRTRPRWATARRLLYGEILEIGRSLLAMTQEEGETVLGSAQRADASGLVALAEGWPAVLGLAALAERAGTPREALSTTLYDYLAQELYDKLPSNVQCALCELAMLSAPTRETVGDYLSGDVELVLVEATRLGFFTTSDSHTYRLHPLLKAFLESKLRERARPELTQMTTRLGNYLMDVSDWDGAFVLLQAFFSEELFDTLLNRAHWSMLSDARLATFTQWAAFGHSQSVDSPSLDLADAEVAFRSADRPKATALSLRAAEHFDRTHILSSHSFYLAGMSLTLDGHDALAFSKFQSALSTARSQTDRRDALWGLAMSSCRREDPEFESHWEALHELKGCDVESDVRILAARFFGLSRLGLAMRHGLLNEYGSLINLLPKIADPIVRTSFLNLYGQVLCWEGHFYKGFAIGEHLATEAQRTRLTFALGHAYRIQAVAKLGLGEYGPATALLEKLTQAATAARDTHMAVEALMIRTRVMLCQGLFERALMPEHLGDLEPAPGELGEYLAWQGLARILLGQHDAGLKLTNTALSTTRSAQVAHLAAFADAVGHIHRGETASAAEHATAALDQIVRLGGFDTLVTVYRACPPILALVASVERHQSILASILSRANDEKLARTVGVPITFHRRTEPSILTRREREVYVLLSQGLSNKEIGSRLFISQPTVKVHAHHIFEKLGVRNRLELALRAAAEIDHATAASESPVR